MANVYTAFLKSNLSFVTSPMARGFVANALRRIAGESDPLDLAAIAELARIMGALTSPLEIMPICGTEAIEDLGNRLADDADRAYELLVTRDYPERSEDKEAARAWIVWARGAARALHAARFAWLSASSTQDVAKLWADALRMLCERR